MSSLEALTGTGIYAKEPGGVSAAPASFVEATVATTPTAVDEEVMVLVGAEGSQLQAGPCRWEPRVTANGFEFPSRGDACLVVTGANGHRAIVWWKPATPATLPFLGAPRVTALPASPVDGQEVAYVADAVKGVLWHLKYNAGSASALKWESVGATPLREDGTSTTATAPFTNWQSAGQPSITVPLAGDYLVEFAAAILYNQAATINQMEFSVLKTGDVDLWSGQHPAVIAPATVGAGGPVGKFEVRANGLTAGQGVYTRYRSTSNQATQCYQPEISLRPVRVA